MKPNPLSHEIEAVLRFGSFDYEARSRLRAWRVWGVLWLVLLLAGCKPEIVREPYPVEVVREVVIPIPTEFTDPLPVPELPQGPLAVLSLVEHIKAWQAFGKVANDHRARVAELSKGE